MKRLAIYCFLSLFVIMSLAVPVCADLIPTAGGILDTQTDLVWASIAGTSGGATLAQLTGPGGPYYGFSYATDAQVQQLFQGALPNATPGSGQITSVLPFGGPGLYYQGETIWNEANSFAQLFGYANKASIYDYFIAGWFDGGYGGAVIEQSAATVGGPPGSYTNPYTVEISIVDGLPYGPGYPTYGLGAWLVEQTPEPASILLVSSLLGIVGVRKICKAKFRTAHFGNRDAG
jgi:hypothetical protein